MNYLGFKMAEDIDENKNDINDGTLNASANCIDRHLKKNKDKTSNIDSLKAHGFLNKRKNKKCNNERTKNLLGINN